MIWSHRFDLLFKLLVVAALVAVPIVLDTPPPALVPAGIPPQYVELTFFGMVAAVLAVGWVLVWRPFLGPAATWLYVWRTLGVRPGWRDARELAVLFSPSLSDGLNWYPCSDVAALPEPQRLPELHARAGRLHAAARAGYFARTRESSPLGRMLRPSVYVAWTVVGLVGIGPIALGAFFQLGPAAFLASWTELSDGTYYPQLSFLFGALAWALGTWPVALAFDRALGPKGEPDARPH